MRRIKEYLISGSIAATCIAGTLSLGDAMDVNRNYATPVLDHVRGVETAEDYAPHHRVDLETRVNDAGKRETYLEFEYDGKNQLTQVSDNGYAAPSLPQRFSDTWDRFSEGVKDTGLYKDFSRALDKAELAFKHYRMQAEEWWDEHVGGDK